MFEALQRDLMRKSYDSRFFIVIHRKMNRRSLTSQLFCNKFQFYYFKYSFITKPKLYERTNFMVFTLCLLELLFD